MVYVESLTTTSPIFLKKQIGYTSKSRTESVGKALSAPLLRISQQIHAEASSFLYGQNSFRFSFNVDNPLPYQLLFTPFIFEHHFKRGDAHNLFGQTRSTYRHLVKELQPEMKFKQHCTENVWTNILKLSGELSKKYKNLYILHIHIVDINLHLGSDWEPIFLKITKNPAEKRFAVNECVAILQTICRLEGKRFPKCLKVNFQSHNSDVTSEAIDMLKLVRRI
jgi:hypothetical protein